MKWYKHISDSLDDPFIFDLMTEFRSDGYVVFFGILEIYSREFSPENQWKLVVSLSYLHQKLRVSPSKVKKILSKIYKWEINYSVNQVSIFIPKFSELMDEWTQRKLGSCSGVAREILIHDKDKDKDKDKEANTNLDDLEYPPFETETLKPEKEKVALVEKLKTTAGDENFTELQELVKQVKNKHPRLPIDTWYGKNRKAHPKAILHVLKSLLKNGDNAEYPYSYLQKALDVENGKYNASDFDREQVVLKKPIPGEMQRLGQIMAQVGV